MALTCIILVSFIIFTSCETSTVMKYVTPPSDVSDYNNTCQPAASYTNTSDCEACRQFDSIVQSAMKFACLDDEEAANKTLDLATKYKQKWSKGPTYGHVLSAKTVEVIRQFVLHYLRISFLRQDLSEKINETSEVRHKLNIFNVESTLPIVRNKTDELIYMLVDYIYNVRAIKYLTVKYGVNNIFFTQHYLEDLLNDTKFVLFIQQLNETLPTEKFAVTANVAIYKIWPTFMGTIFAVGIIANSILLLIFIRHSEMRTVYNVMLANLAFVDLISLIFNLPLTYFLYTKLWDFDFALCQCFLFLRSLTLAVCTYSVVVISYQRVLAVSQFKTSSTTKSSSTVLLVGLWTAAVLYSVPGFFFASTDQEYCQYDNSLYVYYVSVEFFVMCLVPAILVTVFSIIASIRLNRSAHNIPGEKMGQQKRIRNRIVTSRVLIGLVVIFVISYLPKYLFDILMTDPSIQNTYFVTYKNDDWGSYFIMACFFETVLFLNPALNPVVLYFLSTKFKRYFNNYILCRCRSEVS